MSMISNLGEILNPHFLNHPERIALIERGTATTYAQFANRVYACANGLKARGLKKGQRIFILAPVSTDLYALLWSAFYLGLTPVFVDPGLSAKQVKRILSRHQIRAIFSVNKVLRYRFFLPRFWSTRFFSFDSSGFGVDLMETVFMSEKTPVPPEPMAADSEALLTFTTGSTGRPKGADRQLEILLAQHFLSQKYWPENEGEIDMPGFPMVAMQNLACGITTVLPALNGLQAADIDAAQVAADMDLHQVTRLSASPGFMKKLTDYLIAEKRELKTVTRLIVGGAQVPVSLAKNIRSCFPLAQANAVYGSTEAEPIAYVSLDDLIAEKTPGFLLGTPIPEIKLKIVNLPNERVLQERFLREGAQGFEVERGEILIQGPHVVRRYIGDDVANRNTKLTGPDGHWHRTGDYGYLDLKGRLHLLGRSQDRFKIGAKVVPFLMVEKQLE
jgi:olefin beta-lactone synthetase